MSPSRSVSPSPSGVIDGPIDDIIAIKQVDNLTIIQTEASEIVIHKPIDEITIKDVEDIVSGGTTDVIFEIIARKQSDDLIIIKPADEDIRIVD